MEGNFGTVSIINTAIGLLQIAGSGIALLVITLMGIKYILAAPGEKADIKKMATPIVIGCVLVFGAVNLAAIIESFTGNVLE
jgi:type IV secretory pathway VirB2 component (pilin)